MALSLDIKYNQLFDCCLVSPGKRLTNCFRRLNRCRQNKILIVDSTEVRSPSLTDSTASGDYQVSGLRVSECTSKSYLACADLITKKVSDLI